MNKLQQEIQKTEEQLKKLQKQLEATKSITIETAQPGDTLPDGCLVIARYEDSVLIAAPVDTRVISEWTPEFPECFKRLKDHGFIPSQWYVPSKKELQLAYKNCKEQFSSNIFWSSMEFDSTKAYYVDFKDGFTDHIFKTCPGCVRAFRCVVL